MVWPSALHSIARPLQLSAAGGRQIGRGFAPGQQPLPLRKPLPRSSRSSSRQRSLPRSTTTTTKHGAPAITSSCLTLMHDTCPAQTEAHSPHVIFLLYSPHVIYSGFIHYMLCHSHILSLLFAFCFIHQLLSPGEVTVAC